MKTLCQEGVVPWKCTFGRRYPNITFASSTNAAFFRGNVPQNTPFLLKTSSLKFHISWFSDTENSQNKIRLKLCRIYKYVHLHILFNF